MHRCSTRWCAWRPLPPIGRSPPSPRTAPRRRSRPTEPGRRRPSSRGPSPIRSPAGSHVPRGDGPLTSDATATNVTRDDATERLGHLLLARQDPQHGAGSEVRDLGAVAELKETQSVDTLADKGATITVPPLVFPAPVLAYAIEPKTRGDEDKIGTAAPAARGRSDHRLRARPADQGSAALGQGELHIEVTVAKLKRRFGVEVTLKLPRDPLPRDHPVPAEAHGRHKKQTGGHGQFGDCKIKVEPLPRGADFEFVDDIFGGLISRQFVPAVEKGIQEARMRGYLAGYPMVDFRAIVFDGRRFVRSTPTSCRSRWPARWPSRTPWPRRDRPAGTRDARRDADAERLCWRPDGRSQRPPRAHRRHGYPARPPSSAPRCPWPRCSPTSSSSRRPRAAAAPINDRSHYEEVPQHQQPKIIARRRPSGGPRGRGRVTGERYDDPRLRHPDCGGRPADRHTVGYGTRQADAHAPCGRDSGRAERVALSTRPFGVSSRSSLQREACRSGCEHHFRAHGRPRSSA